MKLQQFQKTGKFLRRLGANGLDNIQSLGGTLGIRINHFASTGGVQRHHGHGMGDDIMQFRGDMRAFLGYRGFSPALLFFQ
ncbi:hypothetical protein GCM10009715_08620 [Paeniglutamicibacter psychrophenolicus]